MPSNERLSHVSKAFDPLLLESFCKLVELNSLTRAAESLGLTQPALSKRMRKLQDILGLELMITLPSRIVVTEVGQTFYRDAKTLSDFFTSEWQQLARNETVSLSVEHEILNYVLQPAVEAFARTSTCTIELKTGVSRDNMRSVLAGDSDLAVAQPDEGLPTEITATPLGTLSYQIVFPHAHPLAQRREVSIQDLDELALVVPPHYEIGRRHLLNFFTEHQLRLRMAGETVLYPVALQLVQGLGCAAIVPEYCPVPASLQSRPLPAYPRLPYVLIEHKVRSQDSAYSHFKRAIIQAFASAAPSRSKSDAST